MNIALKMTLLLFYFCGVTGCNFEEPVEVVQPSPPPSFMDALTAPPEDPPEPVHPADVHITAAQMKEFGIVVKEAAAATISLEFQLPGEIVANAAKLVHIGPKVPGVVSEVQKSIGDRVTAGEVLAILDSRELAKSKSQYLACAARVELARSTFTREENLWNQKIGSEQDYLEAKAGFEESKIELRNAKQTLHAIGLSESDVVKLPTEPDTELTRFEMRAPFAGEIISRHLVQGELLQEDSHAFIVADLTEVWVNLAVYQKYLPSIQVGQKVVVSPGTGEQQHNGTLSYISPIIEEATRTATARVVLGNQGGLLRPGLFVTAVISTGNLDVAVAVSKNAITEVSGKTVIFIQSGHGFMPREVETGRSDGVLVEITDGLSVAETYASEGVFSIKSEMQKEDFGSGHGHSH